MENVKSALTTQEVQVNLVMGEDVELILAVQER